MQAWTRNSSVSSQALYHRATAPPLLFEKNAMTSRQMLVLILKTITETSPCEKHPRFAPNI